MLYGHSYTFLDEEECRLLVGDAIGTYTLVQVARPRLDAAAEVHAYVMGTVHRLLPIAAWGDEACDLFLYDASATRAPL